MLSTMSPRAIPGSQWLAPIRFALALLATSCSGGDDDAEADAVDESTTSTSSSTTTAPTTPEATASTTTSTTLAESDPPAEGATAGRAQATADPVQLEGLVRLVDPLDEPEYYCLDVPGVPGGDLDIESDLWAHTCKPGRAIDQVFRDDYRASQLYLPGYDRCLVARAATPGTALGAGDCADIALQGFELDPDGKLRVLSSGPDPLCVAVAPGDGLAVNIAESHLARSLTIESCTSIDPQLATWEFVETENVAEAALTLTAADFSDGDVLPTRLTRCNANATECFPTCADENVSPALSWSGVPETAVELVLIVDDLDPFPHTHWSILGLDPTTTGVPENATGLRFGATGVGNGDQGWLGPCPPAGDGTHTYIFTLYALDTALNADTTAPASELRAAMADTVIASTSLPVRFAAAS